MTRAALAAALLLWGCPHRAPAPQVGDLDAAALWDRVLAAQAQGPATLTAVAKAFVDAPENGGRYSLHLSVKRPASLRVEALTPLGDPAAVLVADEGRFALFDLRRNAFYRGPSTPENLSRLFPLPLRDDELVALFLGGVPELRGGRPASAAREGDGFRIVQRAGAEEQELFVHRDDLRTLRVRRGAWTVTLEEHDAKGGRPLPRVVKLSMPDRRIAIDLRLRGVEVGLPPPRSAFALAPPRGVPVEDLP